MSRTRTTTLVLITVLAIGMAATGYGIAQITHTETEVRITARMNSEKGQVEFGLQQRQADGSWGERILPPARYFPSNAAPDRWLNSTGMPLRVALSDAATSQTASATVTISGRGNDVQTMRLLAGVYFCDISVSGNADAYGAGNFIVEMHGRDGGSELAANEIESSWSARKRIVVGSGLFELRGIVDVEVQAVGSWRVSCARQ